MELTYTEKALLEKCLTLIEYEGITYEEYWEEDGTYHIEEIFRERRLSVAEHDALKKIKAKIRNIKPTAPKI